MTFHNKGFERLKNGIFVPTTHNGPKTVILAFWGIQKEPFVPNAIVKSPVNFKSSVFIVRFHPSWACACSIAGRKSFPAATPSVVDKLFSVLHPWHISSGVLWDEMISRGLLSRCSLT